MFKFISTLGLGTKKVLIISNSDSNNIELSTNNLPKVTTKLWNKVSVRDILNANIVIACEDTFNFYNDQFEKKLSK